MPYGPKDKPSGTGGLPAHARSVFRAAANASYAKHGDDNEEVAHKIAWAAVKNAGYLKSKKSGKWVAGDGMVKDEAIKRAMRMRVDAWDPDQPRESNGEWSGGGGSGRASGGGKSRTSKLLAAAKELKAASGSKVTLPNIGGDVANASKDFPKGSVAKWGDKPVTIVSHRQTKEGWVLSRVKGQGGEKFSVKTEHLDKPEPPEVTYTGAAGGGIVVKPSGGDDDPKTSAMVVPRSLKTEIEARAAGAKGEPSDAYKIFSANASSKEPGERSALEKRVVTAEVLNNTAPEHHEIVEARMTGPDAVAALNEKRRTADRISEAAVAAEKSSDAYMASDYGEKEWGKIARWLAKEKGFGGKEVEAILRSKHPRWAEKGEKNDHTLASFKQHWNSTKDLTSPEGVAELVAGTPEVDERGRYEAKDSLMVADRRRRKTKEYDPLGREKATFEEEDDFDDAAPPLVSAPFVSAIGDSTIDDSPSLVCDAAGGDDMMYDTISLDDDAKVRYTDDGFLVATPRVARVGIQVYRGSECKRADMDTVRIYRPPEEVFNSDAMRSLTHRPMTLDHPAKPVTSANWREHSVGQTGDEVLRDGNAIRVPMVLMDAAAVQAFKDGKNQLSVGYDCDIDWTPGVTDGGENYDAVQRNIKANHVAIVAAARGGPTLRIGDGNNHQTSTSTKENDMNLRTIMVDGLQCQMEDTATTIVQRTINSLQDQIENFKKKLKAKEDEDDDDAEESDAKDAAIKQLQETVKAKDAEIAKHVTAIKTKDAEIVTVKQQVTDAQAQLDPKLLDARVVDRLSVISKAKAFLGDKWTAGGKDTLEIRREVVAGKVGDKAKGWNDSQIEAAFESLQVPSFSQNKHDSARTPIDDAVAAFGRPGAGYTTVADERQAAYSAYDKDLGEAWRTPAGKTH